MCQEKYKNPKAHPVLLPIATASCRATPASAASPAAARYSAAVPPAETACKITRESDSATPGVQSFFHGFAVLIIGSRFYSLCVFGGGIVFSERLMSVEWRKDGARSTVQVFGWVAVG
jgi:hypothetical protein